MRRIRNSYKLGFLFSLFFVVTLMLSGPLFKGEENLDLRIRVELLQEQLRESELKLIELSERTEIDKAPRHNDETLFEVQSKLLRKTQKGMKEFWWYLRAELDKDEYLKKQPSMATFLKAHYWSMQRDITYFRETNSKAVERVEKLQDRIAERLDHLQHPTNCSDVNYIIGDAGPSCGFGCQLHYLVYGLLMAYANNRTLIINDEKWLKSAGRYFEPIVLSQCHDFVMNIEDQKLFSRDNLQFKILILPGIETVESLPYLPQAVPNEIAHDLTAVHGHPSVWWIGQIARYLMRPNKFLMGKIEEVKQRLGFKKPIIGIHIRRTDKIGTEAAFHDVDEYFSKGEEFHHYINLSSGDRGLRVFLATDDPQSYVDAKTRYPAIRILFNVESASLPNAVLGIILDILLLSHCDYLVCTFSSNVCRLAYELMQTRYTDASWRFYSLDDFWYYSGQKHRRFVATMEHAPQNDTKEIELKVGDQLNVAGNEKNGYSVGTNIRTNQRGLFPSYKIEEVTIHARMPRDGPKRES